MLPVCKIASDRVIRAKLAIGQKRRRYWMSGIVRIIVTSGIAFTLVYGALGLMFESMWPAQRLPPGCRMKDFFFSVFGKLAEFVVSPIIVGGTSLLFVYTGHRMLRLPDDTIPRLLCSCVMYLFAFDFIRYWTHRLEHAVPALWAMHSFHHSAANLNVFTGDRVYWMSKIIQGAIMGPVIGLLFVLSPKIVLISMIVQLVFAAMSHMNVRLELGPLGLWFMGPQFHRIHHSIEAQHWGKNYSQTFPLFDVIFGTAWRPAPGEWPEVGLARNPLPVGVFDVVLWPVKFRKLGKIADSGQSTSVETQSAAT
jgi:sterol desaturase/sphingolipid hydroxylase (fatty acid hydroxylase superfamily)